MSDAGGAHSLGDGFSTTPASIALATIFFLPGQLRLNLEACSVEFEDLTKPLFDGFQMFGRHLPYPPIESLLRQRAYLIDNREDGTPRAFHGDQYGGSSLRSARKRNYNHRSTVLVYQAVANHHARMRLTDFGSNGWIESSPPDLTAPVHLPKARRFHPSEHQTPSRFP